MEFLNYFLRLAQYWFIVRRIRGEETGSLGEIDGGDWCEETIAVEYHTTRPAPSIRTIDYTVLATTESEKAFCKEKNTTWAKKLRQVTSTV